MLLQGCIATWIHMEDGTVLRPGGVDFHLSAGMAPTVSGSCPEGRLKTVRGVPSCTRISYETVLDTSTGNYFGKIVGDTTPAALSSGSKAHYAAAWSLGALGSFGPFTGLEVGIQVEGPTDPISQEYRVAVGLPRPDSTWSHSLGAGWGTGMWADDTWFLQYAASWTRGNLRLFGNWRSSLQATRMEFADLPDRFRHDRNWDHQATFGWKYRLAAVPVIPDWIGGAVTFDLNHSALPTTEQSEIDQPTGWGAAWNLTTGWSW